jgi:hypothetical protein
MPVMDLVVAVVAFLVVAGWAAFAWVRKGRDPHYTDDASVLLPAPPPAMTAATATVIAGGDERTAVLTALLDLASRDEIEFVAEGRDGRRDRVGIRFRGGDTTDPRVRLNRRNPIGEAESWLLGEMKAWRASRERTPGGREEMTPEMMAAGMQMFNAMMRAGMQSPDDDDSFAARAAREHGLGTGAPMNVEAMVAAYTAKTGKAFPEEARKRFELMAEMQQAMSDPAAVAADPDKYVAMLEMNAGHSLKPAEREEARQQVAAWAARATQPDPDASYLAAADARRLQATFLFGTLLQRYARRHGWVAGMPIVANIKWGLLAAAEVVVGIAVAGAGNQAGIDPVRWLGYGVIAGGVATFLIARAMPALSRDGAVMKAQLAAYRRTLQQTFAQTSSLDQAVGGRLPWLETPDQALVWGVALGLRKDIEALLARSAAAASGGAFAPTWYASATAALAGVRSAVAAAVAPGEAAGGGGVATAPPAAPASQVPPDPVAMFAGIEAIGSERTSETSSS